MGREFELKYASNPQKHSAIQQRFGAFDTIAMETTYYDTPGGALSARHVTLRRRWEGSTAVCTLKTPTAGLGRGEWELKCGRIEDAVPILCKLSGWTELETLTKDGLVAVCGARFTRRCQTVSLPGCTVEIALDEGVLLGGGRELPLCETEVELKSGEESAAVAFAQSLAREFGLVPEPHSKFRRASALREMDNQSFSRNGITFP